MPNLFHTSTHHSTSQQKRIRLDNIELENASEERWRKGLQISHLPKLQKWTMLNNNLVPQWNGAVENKLCWPHMQGQ
jgi:hypothetical protein